MKNYKALLTVTMQPTWIKPCMKDFISWFPNLQKVLFLLLHLSVEMLRQIIACNQKIDRLRKYDLTVQKLTHGMDCCKGNENYLFLLSAVNRTRRG